MRLRLAVLTALAVTGGLLSVPAGAAISPNRIPTQIRDPKGDVKGDVDGRLAHLDVLTGQWRTTGTGAKRALVATMTLAEKPNTERGFVYEMWADVEGCGSVWFYYAPGNVLDTVDQQGPDYPGAAAVYVACNRTGEGTTIRKALSFAVTGKTLTWSIPLTALPEEVQLGSRFSRFRAIADLAEPAFGKSPMGVLGQPLDIGTGDGLWTMR